VFSFERDGLSFKPTLFFNFMFVDFQVSYGKSLGVQEKLFIVLRNLIKIESNLGLSQIVVSMVECQSEFILNISDKFFPSFCLGFFQNHRSFEGRVYNY